MTTRQIYKLLRKSDAEAATGDSRFAFEIDDRFEDTMTRPQRDPDAPIWE